MFFLCALRPVPRALSPEPRALLLYRVVVIIENSLHKRLVVQPEESAWIARFIGVADSLDAVEALQPRQAKVNIVVGKITSEIESSSC